MTHLVMPMAGRGSRFDREGFALPKPLLPLHGMPFFWWATESVRRALDLASLTFVVLDEHVLNHGIDRAILGLYPAARLVVLPAVTSGALVTARLGCEALPDDGRVIVNDCDHAFDATGLAAAFAGTPAPDGVLCHFHSTNPAYSYASYDDAGRLLRTVEKQPISHLAIAGAYGFRSRAVFLDRVGAYEADCPYAEPFMSGIFNTIAAAGGTTRGHLLRRHLSFGTPAEYERARLEIDAFHHWLPRKAVA